VADGTAIPAENPSNLISYMDGKFGAGAGGGDLTQRPWFHLFTDSFGRWSQLGGISFVYEAHDDGLSLSSSAGILGVRGDVRIGGSYVDGASSTLAYANFPNNGDVVIDTGETTFFSSSTNNYRAFRNTIMHEFGHAFGLDHVESSTDRLLMEPFIDTAFDGPQLDDIRGIQGQYGDANEKAHNFQGNDVFRNATSLGVIAAGATRAVGADALGGQAVSATETDFVSIANSADFDFYSFSVTGPSTLAATLTPLGGVFNQAVQGTAQSSFDANARNDLALTIYGADGTTQVGAANDGAAGYIESLSNIALAAAGQYYVRVSGAGSSVQLYQLQLSIATAAPPSADFDGDGDVDGRDFLALQRGFGASSSVTGDANHDGAVNAADVAVFRQQFGGPNFASTLGMVPEPGGITLVLAAIGSGRLCTRRRRSCFRRPTTAFRAWPPGDAT
jgi:hypothetical protein